MNISSVTMAAMVAMVSTSAAHAEILATATNTVAQVFNSGSAFGVVLDGAENKNTIKFKTSKAGPVLITFYAECAVNGGIYDWVDVDILVDPAGPAGFAPIAPTNDDNAMCTGFGETIEGTGGRWISAVVAGVVDLPKGTHKVKVRGNLAVGEWVRLDDILLTVQN
jgi:hypothetical protein